MMHPGSGKHIKSPRATTASMTVRLLFDIQDKMKVSNVELSKRTGYHAVTLSRWKHGHAMPDFYAVECMAAALDCRVEIRPLKKLPPEVTGG